MNKRPEPTDTAARILDIAEALVQTRGFSGFSYADVATKLQVTTANLHYHYGSKAELGEALVRRYRTRFAGALDAIDARPVKASTKLAAYTRIYADVLRRGRMCLCGMLAAGYETLPAPMRGEVVRFFEDNEQWLVRVLERGRKEEVYSFTGPASVVAQSIISGLEGAMLIARPFGDVERFERAASRLISSVAGATARVPYRGEPRRGRAVQ
ncbi:MAG: TetR/AcrR family transcriptional regulator [Gemmatimonadaceae bacterium]